MHYGKYNFQTPTPNLSSSDRTQQLRSKTVYAGTVNLAKHIAAGNNRYKTYNGPYEVLYQNGNSTLTASRSYSDLLSITQGKVLTNQKPLNSETQEFYQKNIEQGEMYTANYLTFNPAFNFNGLTGCNGSPLIYDIGTTGFTGSYDGATGYIGASGAGTPNTNIFVDPNHCYYSSQCLESKSYLRFVEVNLSGPTGGTITGTGASVARQIITTDQYRGFSYPMSNFNLHCTTLCPNPNPPGPIPPGPIPPAPEQNTLSTTFPSNMYTIIYLKADGTLSNSGPQIGGFTIYQFGVNGEGSIPTDTSKTEYIEFIASSGSGYLDIYYAVVGGGGGGGSGIYFDILSSRPISSGGGGGGYFYTTFPSSTVKLIANTQYFVTVGGGGSAGSITGTGTAAYGNNGQDSVIHYDGGLKTGYGGGGGATATPDGIHPGNGKSGNLLLGNGGGGSGGPEYSGTGGTGFKNGAAGSNDLALAGGGGGMTQLGTISNGGNGVSTSISGGVQYFGGGGGGGAYTNNNDTIAGIGGQGGGGNGGWQNLSGASLVTNGENVFGGGGGGAQSIVYPLSTAPQSGGNGGSGSVWIRFNTYQSM